MWIAFDLTDYSDIYHKNKTLRESSSFGIFIDCKYVTAKTLDISSHIDAVCICWNRQVQWDIEQIWCLNSSVNLWFILIKYINEFLSLILVSLLMLLLLIQLSCLYITWSWIFQNIRVRWDSSCSVSNGIVFITYNND